MISAFIRIASSSLNYCFLVRDLTKMFLVDLSDCLLSQYWLLTVDC